MAIPGKPPKPAAAPGSALRRGPSMTGHRRDPDQTDPAATLLEDDALARELEEADGSVSDVSDDLEVGPGDKTQVYDSNASQAAAPERYKLVVLAGPKAGAEYEIAQDDFTIGRGADNAISIPDVSVSRKHVRLQRDAEGWVVSDLGSGNGTRVNDQRVTSASAKHGDEIAVGDTVMQLVELGAPAVKKGRAPRSAGQPSGETAAPSAPTRGEVQKVASAKAAAPAPVASSRKRLYLVVGVILVVFLGLGALRKRRLAAEQQSGGDVVAGTPGAATLVTEAKRLAKRGQWIAALEKFERAYEETGDTDLERFIEGAKVEAAHEKKLNDAKALLASQDFGAAKEAAALVPETAAVYPQAKAFARELADALDRAASAARNALSDGDRERARSLADKVLASDAGNTVALGVREDLDRRVVKAAAPVKVTIKEREAPAPVKKEAPSGPAVAAYLAGDLQRAMRLAEESDDRLHKQLRAFEVAYREGIAKAQAQRAPDAVRALGQAAKIDRELSQGRPSKPGKEVSSKLATMEYLLGIDCKGDEQLDCASRHFRAALAADPDHDLSKKMVGKVYGRAKELYTEAYLIKSTEPEKAKKMFKKVADTLPADDETHVKAKRWYDKLDGRGGE